MIHLVGDHDVIYMYKEYIYKKVTKMIHLAGDHDVIYMYKGYIYIKSD